MAIIVSMFSALQYWDFQLAKEFFADEILAAGDTQLTVTSMEEYKSHPKPKPTLFRGVLPENSVKKRKGALIALPYLIFLQFAATHGLFATIAFGDLLCACPNGPTSKPHVSRKDLIDYAISAVGVPGRRKALHALKFVKERACSIMEPFLDFHVGLPKVYGGLGVPGGVFNHRVELDEDSKLALKKSCVYVDYYFPDKMIGYEYDGEDHQSTIDNDSSRRLALKSMGIDITTVTKTQLYNPDRLKQLLATIQAAHDADPRIRTEKYYIRFAEIRELYPIRKDEDSK